MLPPTPLNSPYGPYELLRNRQTTSPAGVLCRKTEFINIEFKPMLESCTRKEYDQSTVPTFIMYKSIGKLIKYGIRDKGYVERIV